jgi:hypothetical protein
MVGRVEQSQLLLARRDVEREFVVEIERLFIEQVERLDVLQQLVLVRSAGSR